MLWRKGQNSQFLVAQQGHSQNVKPVAFRLKLPNYNWKKFGAVAKVRPVGVQNENLST